MKSLFLGFGGNHLDPFKKCKSNFFAVEARNYFDSYYVSVCPYLALRNILAKFYTKASVMEVTKSWIEKVSRTEN